MSTIEYILSEMIDLKNVGHEFERDEEDVHQEADKLMIELLLILSRESAEGNKVVKIIDAYKEVPKWYA